MIDYPKAMYYVLEYDIGWRTLFFYSTSRSEIDAALSHWIRIYPQGSYKLLYLREVYRETETSESFERQENFC